MRLMVAAGTGCEELMDEQMRELCRAAYGRDQVACGCSAGGDGGGAQI
jgi:hypothetical protein